MVVKCENCLLLQHEDYHPNMQLNTLSQLSAR